MSEGRGHDFGSLDSRMLLYLPRWARRLTMAALLLLLALSTGLCAYVLFFRPGFGADVLLFGLSIVQTSMVGIVFVLVLFYSRRDANMAMLIAESDEFLKRHVCHALSRISVPSHGIESFSVTDAGTKDIFGHLFILKSPSLTVPLWVGLNVRRLFVIYYVQREGEDFVRRAEQIFAFTFGGASQVGFKANFEPAEVDGEPILSIWLSAEAEPDLLTNPLEKLFWAQDVAMMTESFIRTALRNDLKLATRCLPAPL